MRKQFILPIVSFIFFQFFLINQSFSKSLPPGSGAGDVPANVLILLDKSGSMGWSMDTGAGLKRPTNIALGQDDDKNVITSPENGTYGIRNVAYTNALKAIGSTTKYKSDPNCNGSIGFESHLEQYGGKIYYFRGINNFSYGCSVNITTGAVTKFYNPAGFSTVYGTDLKDQYLYVWYKNSSNRLKINIFDLDNNASQIAECDVGGNELQMTLLQHLVFTGSFLEIDKSGSYMMGIEPMGAANSSRMHQFELSSGLGSCPNITPSNTYTVPVKFTQLKDIEIHPTKADTFLISKQFKIYEYNIAINQFDTGGTNGIGKFRSNFKRNYSPRNINQIQFNRAHGIAVDVTNERIYVADRLADKIQVFDKNWGFIKIMGSTGTGGSRMVAASNAIKDVVTDSNLTSGAHFGFGYWSNSVTVWYTWQKWWHSWPTCINQMASINNEIGIDSSHWVYNPQGNGGYWCDIERRPKGFLSWDVAKDESIPCTTNNCLKAQVNREGAAKTGRKVKQVVPGGGTRAKDFTKIASDYFNHPTESPDKDIDCQSNYVIIIGDGDWFTHEAALNETKALLNDKIKTYAIAFGPGITDAGLLNFDDLAVAGGTDRVRIATDGGQLKEVLNDIIGNIVGDRVSFTSPSITAKVSEGGTLLQAQFQYVKRQEWNGFIKKTKLNELGAPIPNHPDNWEADERMPAPNARKIWTQMEDSSDYLTNYNNVVDTNANELRNMFERFGGEILDYHRDTAEVGGGDRNRCSARVSSIEDGDSDDLRGLINFIRGEDYFDYNGDCILDEAREKYLGDIYNSDILVVGKPSADVRYTSDKQESYWRAKQGYNTFKTDNANRADAIYVGANDGLLHSFDFKSGIENWAFLPPFLFPQMSRLINPTFNVLTPAPGGGTNAIFGVDGSPVQHDIFMYGINQTGKRETVKSWKSILIVPYGKGGAGFSILDVTVNDKPIHYFSVYNDQKTNTVYRMNHKGEVEKEEYLPSSFSLAEFPAAEETADRFQADETISITCDASKTTSCHKAWSWTLPEVFHSIIDKSGNNVTVTKNDFEVTIDGAETDLFSVGSDSNGDPTIIFSSQEIFFQMATGPGTTAGQSVGIRIKNSSSLKTISLDPDYDYSKLGETWSSPRVLRMPIDKKVNNDIYVAVMGAGFGNEFSGVGSGVFLINLEDTDKPYKIEKFIEIPDIANSKDGLKEINNSVPGDPMIISADSATNYTNYRGALVYVNDYEGKITKINLTDMEKDKFGVPISLYDSYVMFDSQTTVDNARYMFHSMDATIGRKTKKLWLFAGSGDMNNLVDKNSNIKNILLGVADDDFPYYHNPAPTNPPPSINNLLNCELTTGVTDILLCPTIPNTPAGGLEKVGWYVELPDAKKVTAEPTVAGGVVYYPVYKPPLDPCKLGPATICAIDDECGTNLSGDLGTDAKDDECHYVGLGILSKIVAFGGKLYANIAGETADGKDLISKAAIGIEIEVGRNAWRQQQ
mgnify:FL=1